MGLLDILNPKKNDTKPRASKRDDLAKKLAEHAENLAARRARRAQTRGEVERLASVDTAGMSEAQLLELYEQKHAAEKVDFAVKHIEAQAETAEREATEALKAHDVAEKRAEFQKLEDYWAGFDARAVEIDQMLGALIIECHGHIEKQRAAVVELHTFEEAMGHEKSRSHTELLERLVHARAAIMRARGSEDGSPRLRGLGNHHTVEEVIPALLGLRGTF